MIHPKFDLAGKTKKKNYFIVKQLPHIAIKNAAKSDLEVVSIIRHEFKPYTRQ